MLTKKDIDLLLEHFITKTEFDQAIEKLATKEEFKQKFDLVITTLDAVLGEVKAMRQEQIINSQRFDDTNKGIGGLKKRVKRLEDNQPSSAHPL